MDKQAFDLMMEQFSDIKQDLAEIKQGQAQHQLRDDAVHATLMQTSNENKTYIGVHRKALYIMASVMLGVLVYLSSKDTQALAQIVDIGKVVK